MPVLTLLQRSRALVATALLALAACGGDDPLAPLTVSSVEIAPFTMPLIVGDSVRLTATPRSAGGTVLADRVVAWASSDTSLATVSAAGTVRALGVGDVAITASVEGITSGVEFSIDPVPAAAIMLHATEVALREGQLRQMTAVLLDAHGAPLPDEREITWSAVDTAIATVDASGLVQARAAGSTTIIARHGALAAQATLVVSVEWAAQIMYEAHDATSSFPYLFVFEPMQSPIVPAKAIAFAGVRHAAPSPDGTRIAFTCDVAICVADRDGTDIDILTMGDLSYEDSPTWSPDGQRIAFRRWAQGGSAEQVEQTDIWVMNADGSAPTNITSDATSQSDPAWSPVRADGGTRIAYRQMAIVDGYVTNRLYTMRPDGTDRRAETAAGLVNATEPSWTPDGTRLVYVQDGGEVTADLWIVTVGAGDARALMPAAISGDQRSPAVAPDGRHVLFTSTHEEVAGVGFKRQLFTVRIDGTQVERRTSDAADKDHPVWRVRE